MTRFPLTPAVFAAGLAAGVWAAGTTPADAPKPTAADAPKPPAAVAPAAPRPADAVTRATVKRQLHAVALGLHEYHDATQAFPNNLADKAGKPLLSWRVAILPYIGHVGLFSKFKLDEPWDSDHNKPLLAKMPAVYRLPGQPAGDTATYFQGLDGPGTLFERGKTLRMPASFPDGTSNTLAVLAAGPAVPWTKPADLPFDPADPKFPESPYPNVLLACTCDGWASQYKPAFDPALYFKLAVRDDNQANGDDSKAVFPVARLTPAEQSVAAAQLDAIASARDEIEKLLEERKKLLAEAYKRGAADLGHEVDLKPLLAEGERLRALAAELKADVWRLQFDLDWRAESRRAIAADEAP